MRPATLLFLTAFAAYALLSGPRAGAAGPDGAPFKIGVVDIARVFKEAKASAIAREAANKKLEGEAEGLKQEFIEIERMKQEVSLLRPGTDVYRQKEEEIVKREAWLKFRSDTSQERMRDYLQKEDERIYEEIRGVIRDFAAANGYSLILKVEESSIVSEAPQGHFAKMNARGVLYHDKGYEVTAEILKRYDEKTSAAPAPPPAPGVTPGPAPSPTQAP